MTEMNNKYQILSSYHIVENAKEASIKLKNEPIVVIN